MVDRRYVEDQLKKIKFDNTWFNRAEIAELENVLLDEEEIYECVNGLYEGGVALLAATDIRILLIDKKPMGYLNVDDLRFDMISDIDYSHRVFGAQIRINCGMKNMVFKSYNQPRLRKLITHVQNRISSIKKEQNEHATTQRQHLEDINKQLQIYLLAQQQQLESQVYSNSSVAPLKPSPKLTDYLFAQRLLESLGSKKRTEDLPKANLSEENKLPPPKIANEPIPEVDERQLRIEMEEAGRLEILGLTDRVSHHRLGKSQADTSSGNLTQVFDLSPIKIAYAKLPYLLRSRRYKAKLSTENLS